jgi:branched-chain amino acid transport system permease protein
VETFLTYTIVGLTTAAIYAVIASGLVLTYTTTGVFNFAHGATGMLAAFLYWQLRSPDAWGWPAPIALFVVLGILAPAFGVLLEVVVMRGLQATTEATKLVVSISLLAGLIGAANWIWNPTVDRNVPKFFESSRGIKVASTYITPHQLITMAVAIGVAIALRFLLYRTRIGVAMRASVDDRSLATLNGARADRVSMLAWAAGSVLAAIGGILIANVGLDSGMLSLLIVNAYAAAIFGRLRSLPFTFFGAVILGCTDAYLLGYAPDSTYWAGLRIASPAILLFCLLLALPNPRLRGRIRSREWFQKPSWGGTSTFSALIVLAAAMLATTLSPADATIYARIFPFAIFALSLVPLTGFAGQISLCQLSFAGIGAVVWAHQGGSGNPIWLLGAAIVAGLVGALVALPALRLSGIYLALATGGFAVILDRWIWGLPDFEIFGKIKISLFETGSTTAAPVKLFGYAFDTPARQMMLTAGAFAALAFAVVAIRRSALGRRLLAMKDSEAACATIGMRLLGTKLAVFTVSAAMAGFGGALYASQLGSIQPGLFDFISGLPVFMLAVVGGIGLAGGALFAGAGLQGALPLISQLGATFANIAGILPGLAGVGLGRNPNGAVADAREPFMPAWRNKLLLLGVVGGDIVAWGFRLAKAYGNWMFVVLAGAWTGVGLIVIAARGREAGVPRIEGVPLEWLGITEPWDGTRVRALDERLGVNEAELHGVA